MKWNDLLTAASLSDVGMIETGKVLNYILQLFFYRSVIKAIAQGYSHHDEKHHNFRVSIRSSFKSNDR